MIRLSALPLRVIMTASIVLTSLLTLTSALLTSYTLAKEQLIDSVARDKAAQQQPLLMLRDKHVVALRQFLTQQPDFRHAYISGADGTYQPLTGSDTGLYTTLLPDSSPGSELQYRYDRATRNLTLIQRFTHSDANLADQYLQTTFSLQKRITALQQRYLVEAGLLALIGLIGIFSVTQTLRIRVIRPLELLAQNAGLIARGSYDTQTHLRGKNEIGQLAAALNRIGQESSQQLEKLRKRNQQLHGFLHCGLVSMLVENDQKQFTEANDTLQQILGYDLPSLLSMGWHDIIHPDSQPELEALRSLLRLDQGEVETELKVLSRDGRVLWLQISAKCLHQHPAAAPSFVYFISDITRRKATENELRLAAVAFETQEAILVADAGTTILKVNNAFTQITGYHPAEAIGGKTNLLQSGKHDRQFYKQMWSALELEGRWQGEIWNRKKSGQIYPQWQTITAVKNEWGRITHYIACFQDISERKRAEDEIKQLAYYDELTGLPNRRMFYQRLQQALSLCQRSKHHGALLFIDLDHFKDVNDSLGHLFGDRLLQEVSMRLDDIVRTTDTLARLGGDEFVIMMEHLSSDYTSASQACQILAERMIERLRQPYQINGQTLRISASVGISLFPGDSDDIDSLLRQADTAMYKSKASGRATLRFFSQDMQTQANARLQLRSDLEQAIRLDQFRLYLQPQVSLQDSSITGSECLIRWQHPTRGLIAPDQFIGIAEESDLIVEIGQWALAEASRMQQRLSADDLDGGRLSVNIAPKHFHRPNFVEDTLAIIKAHGGDPSYLCIEITEGVAIDSLEDAASKIHQLQMAGIWVAIDDFGTGYSSLSYLINLQARELKLDRSFILQLEHNRKAQLMVHSILELARQLHIQVVAEGVETAEQRQLLQQLGCRIMQGYLESRPLPFDDFCQHLRQRPDSVAISSSSRGLTHN